MNLMLINIIHDWIKEIRVKEKNIFEKVGMRKEEEDGGFSTLPYYFQNWEEERKKNRVNNIELINIELEL